MRENMILIFISMYSVVSSQYIGSEASPLVGKKVKVAKKKDFPFIVSIGDKDDKYPAYINHFCTGSLVSKKHVLTAAHCLDNRILDQMQVSMGSVDLANVKKYTISSKMKFNEWTKDDITPKELSLNDIAIITLEEEVTDPNMKLVDYESSKNEDLAGLTGKLAGWGISNANRTPRLLQKGTVKMISNRDCETKIKEKTGKSYSLQDRFMCSAADPHLLVQCGDSGGPLMDEDKKILLAVNMGTCPCLLQTPDNYPLLFNLHARIDYYRTFINDVINST